MQHMQAPVQRPTGAQRLGRIEMRGRQAQVQARRLGHPLRQVARQPLRRLPAASGGMRPAPARRRR
jgi:hypothetical protein